MAKYDEIEAVVGNQRKRIYLLVGVAAAAIGIGAALQLMPRPRGADEEGHKVVIIDDDAGGLAAYLGGYGFEAITGDLDDWKASIPEKAPQLIEGEVGLEEVFAFADEYGYGYVVVENPARLDYAGLDIEPAPSFSESDSFAVFSVGDFGFPSLMTVSPPSSEVMSSRGIDLLRTLFLQEKLAETLQPEDASMDGITLRSKLSKAVDLLEQLAVLDDKVAQIQTDTRNELEAKTAMGNGKIKVLDEIHEGSSFHPLADGRLMQISQAVSLTSENGIRLDLEPGRTFSLSALPAGAAMSPEARQPCAELFGGTLDRAERLGTESARDGSAALIQTVSDGTHLFTFDAKAGACGLKDEGKVDIPDAARGYIAVSQKRVATKTREDGLAIVDVLDPGGGNTRFGFVPTVGTKSLAWLDERHLVFLNYVEVPADAPEGTPELALVFLSLDRPDLALELRVAGLDEVYEIFALPSVEKGKAKPSLIVRTRSGYTNELQRVDFGVDGWDALFENPPRDPALADLERDDLPTVVHLDIGAVESTRVLSVDHATKPFTVSPDGKWAALTTWSDGGKEVLLVAIPPRGGATNAPIVVTDDEWYDRDPAFTRDGKRLVWITEHELGDVDGKVWSIRGAEMAGLTAP